MSTPPERSMSLNLDSWLGGAGFDQSNLEELLQVNESFFDAYVQELEGQIGAPSQAGMPVPTTLPAPFASAPNGVAAPMPAALVSFPPPTQFSYPGYSFQSQSVPMTGVQSMPLPHIVQSLPPAQTLVQPTSSTSIPSTVTPPMSLAVTTGVPEQDRSSEQQPEHGSNSGGGDSGGDYIEIEEIDSFGKKKKRRIRTPKQQVLNKLAQQRYRERRKAKYSEMETTVEALVDQLEKLQTVEKQNQALAKRNEEMAKQLHDQQEQLKFLKEQLAFSTQAAAVSAAQKGLGPDSAGEKAAPPDYEDLRKRLGTLVSSLQDTLAQYNLTDELDSNMLKQLPPNVIKELAAAVAESCALCMQLVASNAPHVTQAMSKDTGRFFEISCPVVRAVWSKALQGLNLSRTQEEMLLELREKHLKSLRVLYDERHRLNLQAMTLMLPRPSQLMDPTPEGKVRSMTVFGQMCGLKQDGALGSVLDAVRSNLNAERKGFVELNYNLLHKVLTPVQSAKLLVDTYPQNIDALALANCLAVKKGLQPQTALPEECSREFQASALCMGLKTEMVQTPQTAA